MALVLLGPVVAVVGALVLAREQAQRMSAGVFCLVGIAGIYASISGLLAPEPFLLPTNAFFGMVATLDTFAAMMYAPFSVIVFALGVHWLTHNAEPRSWLSVLGVALMTIGTTWVLLSTNILGVIAAFMVLLCAEACLFFERTSGIVLRSFGVLMIAAGLFILSSGALFNDFATLAYISAELDPFRLAGAFGSILIGIAAFAGAWPFARIAMAQETHAVNPMARAIARTAMFIVPIYVFIRLLLFVFPPLTVWFAVPVGIFGVMTLVCAMQRHATENPYNGATFIHGIGAVLFMLSVTMIFQSLGMYEAMNIVLFATLVQSMGVVLAGAAKESAQQHDVFARTGMYVAQMGLPISFIFVSQWMFGSVVLLQLSALPRGIGLWIAFGLLVLLGSMARRGYRALVQLRGVAAYPQQSIQSQHNIAMYVLVGLSTFGALGIPFALFSIGAGPLTRDAQTWNGAIVVGDSVLRPAILLGGIILLSAVYWVLRKKTFQFSVTEQGSIEKGMDSDDAVTDVSRVRMFFREMRKICIQYMVMPVKERWQALQTWHDHYATRIVTPSIAFMILTVIITFIIAL